MRKILDQVFGKHTISMENRNRGASSEGKRYKQWVYYFEGGMIKEVYQIIIMRVNLKLFIISFDQFGTPVSKSFYKNNKINGQYLEFYYNGRVALSGHYDIGKQGQFMD